MFTIYIALLFFIIVVLYLTPKHNKTTTNQQKELFKLEKIIQLKQKELSHLENKLDTIKSPFSYSTHVTNALNLYQNSFIKLPVDILEELSFFNDSFTSTTDVVTFIENQRNNWKIENTKRLLKK